MADQRPAAFISSTIYDFRDLRSALRHWLEEYGFDVLASEWNDFPQRPDKNSYESCLRAIDSAAYFVLPIGCRVGGWYDRSKLVSITRAEYRYAYELAKAGRLQILTFVRQEIWDAKQDRGALAKFLAEQHALDVELSEDDKRKLVLHPSKFVGDAEFVFDFLDEVGRKGEMQKALSGASPYPVGNWIYQFSTFKDVADACRSAMRLSGNSRQRSLGASLLHELRSTLKSMMTARDGQPIAPFTALCAPAGRVCSADSPMYRLSMTEAAGIKEFIVRSWDLRGLSMPILAEAVVSCEFLDFDRASGEYRVGSLQTVLLRLQRRAERLRISSGSNSLVDLVTRIGTMQREWSQDATVLFPRVDLRDVLSLHAETERFIDTTCRLLSALQGDDDSLASLLSAEEIPDESLDAWLGQRSPPSGLTGPHFTRTLDRPEQRRMTHEPAADPS